MESDDGVLRNLYSEISNWGRWGETDTLGTLNLIGPEQRLRAARTVTRGVTVNCARPIKTTTNRGDEQGDAHSSPAEIEVIIDGGEVPGTGAGLAVDRFTVMPHGSFHTHLDALNHLFLDGLSYNGRPASEVAVPGAATNGIDAIEGVICTRGVLLDVAAVRGSYVRAEEEVRIEDLLEAERRAGVTVGRGDALFVRLGREVRWAAEGGSCCERLDEGGVIAGLHPECLTFLRERDVAVLASDAGTDQMPPKFGLTLPVHIGTIVFLGMPLLDGADMEELSRTCAANQRWEFLLTLSPLAIPGATGSLVNPIALF